MLCCQTFAYNFTTGTDIRVVSLYIPYSTPPVSQKNRTSTRKGKKKDLLKQVIGYFSLISA
jgi:hypothetical protein